MTDPMAQAVMVAYCRWDPTAAVVDQTVNLTGNGTDTLFLPSLYVTGVSAVTVTIPVDAPTVSWDESGVLTWLSAENCGRWPTQQQSIAVTYSGGYASVPADLAAALASLSGRITTAVGAQSKRLGAASVTYGQVIANGGLLTTEQMVFDRYRLPAGA